MNCHLSPVVILLLLSSSLLAQWQPPENPDPSTILSEAHADTRAGRFPDALAKHVWYHENAIKFDGAQTGVRRSFALAYWNELAERFPPARKKLEECRQESRKRVLANKKVFHDFADFASISKELEKDDETVKLFVALDAKDPQLAKQAYNSAEDALIAAKKYRLCGKYIDGDKAIGREIEKLEHYRQLANDQRFGPDITRHGEDAFRKRAPTIVAILVKCGREEESSRVAEEARKAWDDASPHDALDRALKGELPKDAG
jgi:hypothetical protein